MEGEREGGHRIGRQEISGVPVFFANPSGPLLRDHRSAIDLIEAAWSHQTSFVAVPVQRLACDFFSLATGVAGAILQTFANLGGRIVIIGDISRELAASSALQAFVTESNRRDHVWFLSDVAALEARLTRQGGSDRRARS